jgi:hypothetical protein
MNQDQFKQPRYKVCKRVCGTHQLVSYCKTWQTALDTADQVGREHDDNVVIFDLRNGQQYSITRRTPVN